MSEHIRVVIVDDHAMVRRGLRAFLDVLDDIEVVGEASGGDECVTLASTLQPDVILLDLVMPGMGGIDTLRALRESGSTARVLIVTSFTDPAGVVPAIRSGASGVVYKDIDPTDLASAIRSVHAGHVVLQPEVAAALTAPAAPADRLASLTAREREVLAELALGRSNREIAKVLMLAEKTVKTHVSNILMKLGVADRTQAAILAVHAGSADHRS